MQTQCVEWRSDRVWAIVVGSAEPAYDSSLLISICDPISTLGAVAGDGLNWILGSWSNSETAMMMLFQLIHSSVITTCFQYQHKCLVERQSRNR